MLEAAAANAAAEEAEEDSKSVIEVGDNTSDESELEDKWGDPDWIPRPRSEWILDGPDMDEIVEVPDAELPDPRVDGTYSIQSEGDVYQDTRFSLIWQPDFRSFKETTEWKKEVNQHCSGPYI